MSYLIAISIAAIFVVVMIFMMSIVVFVGVAAISFVLAQVARTVRFTGKIAGIVLTTVGETCFDATAANIRIIRNSK